MTRRVYIHNETLANNSAQQLGAGDAGLRLFVIPESVARRA
jgi:hypothetical protein